MNIINRSIILFLILFASGCNLSPQTPVPVVRATMPVIQIAQQATIAPPATETRSIRNIPTVTDPPPSATPEPTVSPYICGVEQMGESARHRIVANMDYSTRNIGLSHEVMFRNDTDVALQDVVLVVEPNIIADTFTLETLQLNGSDVFHTLESNQLSIFLPIPMNPGCELKLNLRYQILVPRTAVGIRSFKGFFGWGDRQVNLGHWLPTVAFRKDNEWVVNEPQTIGEQHALGLADWDLTLNVDNAGGAVMLAAPGTVTEREENRWQITHNSARDLTLSMGRSMRRIVQMSETGIQVEVYHFGDAVRDTGSGFADGAAHALEVAVISVDQYSSLFGAPPYDRLLIVQGDFPDGMEFSGIVFVSTNWFYSFEGGVQNYLTAITVHEVAHQWWYASVGNDAANDPWLDEALSTYSEYIFFEEYYPAFKDWWWSWRVALFNPQGAVDSTVDEFEEGRAYINAVYLRGAQMLHNLRDDIGTQAFFDLLATYAQAGQGQVVDSDFFWSLLTPEQLEATQATRDEFFESLSIVSD